MTLLLWANPSTNNKFGNKHLYVVGGAASLQQLIDEGRKVFSARLEAYRMRGRKSVMAKQLKETYGSSTAVTSNTLIVLNSGGIQALESEIKNKGYKTGYYTVKSGVIFNVTGSGCSEGLVAKLHLAVRPCLGGHEVWHLEGAELKAKLKSNVPVAAYSQVTVTSAPGDNGILGLHYTPTVGQLAAAKAGLKPVTPRVSSGLPAPSEIGNIKLIDLSFLDD
ncbi:hypothetical protein [Mesorhizobium sp. A623]